MRHERGHKARLCLTPSRHWLPLSLTKDLPVGKRSNTNAARLRRLEKSKEHKRRTREPGEKNSKRLTRTYDQIAQLRATAKRRAIDGQHKTTTGIAESADTNASRNIDHAAGHAVSGLLSPRQ
ncbi:hypothetical protein ACFVX6_11820 [Streptomyces sp. NPDC058289]|uniref:hypothetical protein n=1 Tax=Streptomyces sp. NPDC058289 TaxID=3346425 RepID=UPI0036E0A257